MPPVIYSDVHRRDTVLDALEELRVSGVASLPCLSPDECAAMNTGMWDALEFVTSGRPFSVKQDDPTTYKFISQLAPKKGMLLQHYGFTYARYARAVREHPKVRLPFQAYFGTSDLHCSLDGVSIGLGPCVPNNPRRALCLKSGTLDDAPLAPFHLDQALGSPEVDMIQGLVTANRVKAGDAGLRVIANSHKYFEQFASEFGLESRKQNWLALEPEHIEWYLAQPGCVDRVIACAPGEQVIWNSKTVHCGQAAFAPDQVGLESGTVRNVVYSTYAPSALSTQSSRLKRLAAFTPGKSLYGRTFSHWPDQMTPFAKYPRYGTQDAKLILPPSIDGLTQEQRELYGLD